MSGGADPKSVRVKVSSGSGLEIEWEDGHHSSYTFRFLRDACPCAECSEERRQESRRPGEPKQLRPGDLFVRPLPRLVRAEPEGKYAIRFLWDDGHQGGDYSWEFLRDVCPCGSCAVAGANSQQRGR